MPYFGTAIVFLHLLTPFLAGAAFRLYEDRIPRNRWVFAVAVAALVATHRKFFNGVVPVAGTYAMFYVAFSERLPLQGFGRFGDFSYGAYLYSFPIQQLLVMNWPGVAAIPLFAVSLPLSLVAAFLSWHLVERWFLNRKAAPPPERLPVAERVAVP